MGHHSIKERAGLKTGKKQNLSAPYFLIMPNSGCRRIRLYLGEKCMKLYEQCTQGRREG
jgi:hypothetical protein